MYEKGRYLLSGDKGLLIEFGNEISEEVNRKVRSMCLAIGKSGINGIIDMIPAYRSLLVNYNPLEIDLDTLVERLREIEGNLDNMMLPEPRIIELPTLYGGEYGEDLSFVAEHNGISEAEVIRLHSSVDYLVYMLGFTPGFPYLGGIHEKLEAPRLKEPRIKIPAGSVGIAGRQTGVYPTESPGGWRIIGRTPVKLYDPDIDPPVILRAGDYIRFVPIGEEEYHTISGSVDAKKYKITMAESRR